MTQNNLIVKTFCRRSNEALRKKDKIADGEKSLITRTVTKILTHFVFVNHFYLKYP